MNNSIDDWLNQLQTPEPAQEVPHPGADLPIVSQPPAAEETPEESPSQRLSDNDFTSILSDLGFEEAQDIEAEEITEVESGSREEVISTDGALEAVRSVNDDDYPSENPDASPVERATSEQDSSVDSNTIAVHSSQEPLLPSNSPTLLMDDTTSRFSGTDWFSEIQKQRIIIAGCGGIGSWLSLNIARLHPEAIFLYDHDTVEMGNMSGQLFRHQDVGGSKVSAVTDVIYSLTSMSHVYARDVFFNSESPAGPIMICGFDSMEARKIFFNAWNTRLSSLEEGERKKCLYLDGRLSIDTLQVFCIRGDDHYNIERYQNEFLFSDEEADETICSMKQTTYMACMIGSLMTNLFVNHVANLQNPAIPYDMPFFMEYDAQNMIFKTEN